MSLFPLFSNLLPNPSSGQSFLDCAISVTVRVNMILVSIKISNLNTANYILLGPNYAMKKTDLSCDASHFDVSYATSGHNGKISVFLPRSIEGGAKEIYSAIPGMCHLWTNEGTGDQSNGSHPVTRD